MRLAPLLAFLALASPVFAQETAEPPVTQEDDPFHFGGELKTGFRWSQAQQSTVFGSRSQPIGFMKTPDVGSAFEFQHLAITGEGHITSGVFAKFEVRFLDQYNRNPSSADQVVFVRQAFVRFGDKSQRLSGERGSRFYAQIGMAPRFSKQMVRRLESYGLWGTAVGRFEQPQVELGATFGPRIYARAMAGAGNTLFLRDTNPLAGDNQTQTPDPSAVHATDFPILYDAKYQGVNSTRHSEVGAGLGVRAGGGDKAGFDLLGWYFTRRLAPTASIYESEYPGELAVLKGAGFPIPTSGNRRREWGVNLEGRAAGLRFFGQWIDQDLAGAGRHGVEAEAAWNIALPGLFLVGESPFGNWIQPAFRFSWIHNDFTAPLPYPRLSVVWPWKKYDFALRMGLVRNVDVTAEYTFHQVFRFAGAPNLPMKEFLVTLRAGF